MPDKASGWISSANSNAFYLGESTYGDLIRVVEGSGSYSGVAESQPIGPWGWRGEVHIAYTGVDHCRSDITAGTRDATATVDYQWQYSDSSGANFTNAGTNSPTFLDSHVQQRLHQSHCHGQRCVHGDGPSDLA